LTNHDVISVLKTSGIQERVEHRKLILPQLAATGIEGETVYDKTGWKVVWGPVDAADIGAFLSNGREENVETRMRTVRFAWPARVEMAVAWAFPMSVPALLGFPIWGDHLLPLLGLIWGLPLALFLVFPLYRGYLHHQGTGTGTNVVWRQVTVGLFLWLLFMTALIIIYALAPEGGLSREWVGRWGLVSLIISLVLCVDLMGSTPVYKSGLHEERQLRITLDPDLCEGVGICETVCPANVFDVDYLEQTAATARAEDCVRCGACIVQCPLDALLFMSSKGYVVSPDTVRRFKLNLMGKRMVKADKAQ
jgi:NAD-dependent dihydropyrimidine dehydrogenase PreA subunit